MKLPNGVEAVLDSVEQLARLVKALDSKPPASEPSTTSRQVPPRAPVTAVPEITASERHPVAEPAAQRSEPSRSVTGVSVAASSAWTRESAERFFASLSTMQQSAVSFLASMPSDWAESELLARHLGFRTGNGLGPFYKGLEEAAQRLGLPSPVQKLRMRRPLVRLDPGLKAGLAWTQPRQTGLLAVSGGQAK